MAPDIPGDRDVVRLRLPAIGANATLERSGGDAGGSRHRPARSTPARAATFDTPARKVRPGKAEEARNPRARSATLRSAVRTAAPAWPDNSQKESMSC